jgi:hypothetical protein
MLAMICAPPLGAIPAYATAPALSLVLLSFTFVKLGTGGHCEISPLWVLSVLFLRCYAFLGPE